MSLVRSCALGKTVREPITPASMCIAKRLKQSDSVGIAAATNLLLLDGNRHFTLATCGSDNILRKSRQIRTHRKDGVDVQRKHNDVYMSGQSQVHGNCKEEIPHMFRKGSEQRGDSLAVRSKLDEREKDSRMFDLS